MTPTEREAKERRVRELQAQIAPLMKERGELEDELSRERRRRRFAAAHDPWGPTLALVKTKELSDG